METQKLSPHLQQTLKDLGIVNPDNLTTKQASAYLKSKGLPVAPSSLEVYRCTSRGPKYKKIISRIFYTIEWLDQWAEGIEVKIYDPTQNIQRRAA